MFYCNECGQKAGWPIGTIMQSRGACEICDKPALCNDVPSSHLPPARKKETTMGKQPGSPDEDAGFVEGDMMRTRCFTPKAEIPPNHVHVAVVGSPRSGKTTLALILKKALVEAGFKVSLEDEDSEGWYLESEMQDKRADLLQKRQPEIVIKQVQIPRSAIRGG